MRNGDTEAASVCKGGHGCGNTGTYIGTVTGEIEMRQRRALRKLKAPPKFKSFSQVLRPVRSGFDAG